MHELRRSAELGAAEVISAAAAKPVTQVVLLNKDDRTSFVAGRSLDGVSYCFAIQPTAVAPDGLSCQSRQERSWGGIRGTHAVKSGSYYFEVAIEDDGLGRVGWATAAASYELGCDRQVSVVSRACLNRTSCS